MKSFEPYILELENLTSRLLGSYTVSNQDNLAVEQALNGQPSKALRSLIPLSDLRESGVFFTNRYLADQVAALIIKEIEQGAKINDPACGAGDLLIACARHLPISEDLEETLSNWSQRLKGADIHSNFIKATKLRLVLLAITRGAKSQKHSLILEHLFPNIQNRDALIFSETAFSANCVVINPPYTMVQTPKLCVWTSGLVSQAALFLEKCVENVPPGTKIIAILPDVLRTGSRYIKWRQNLERYVTIEEIKLVGCFDTLTDIDTFICHLAVGNTIPTRSKDWWVSNDKINLAPQKVIDHFEVRVGAVIPHRHHLNGPLRPYIHARQLPRWKSIEANFEFRNFSGTTFIPPFVVVRRTSRPTDKDRAIGTIIEGESPVAVENHLIVLKPRSNSLADCFKLLEILRCYKTSDWLNERIRCRHLTVTAISNLPWWTEDEF